MDGLTLFILVTWMVAVARVTRLINADQLTDPIRIWVAHRFGPESTWVYFLECPWCVSMWVGFATAAFPIWLTHTSWWLLPVIALTASHVTGLMAALDGDDAHITVQDE